MDRTHSNPIRGRERRRGVSARTLCVFSGSAVALLLLIGVAQGSAEVRGTAGAASANRSATSSPEADQIRATERKRLHALVDADVTTVRALSSEDFQLVNPAGGTASLDEYLPAVAAGDINYLVFEPASPITVRLYGRVAALRFQVNFDLVVFGLRLTHQAWITELYEKNHGDWQIVWEQATAIPNDFGLFLQSISP